MFIRGSATSLSVILVFTECLSVYTLLDHTVTMRRMVVKSVELTNYLQIEDHPTRNIRARIQRKDILIITSRSIPNTKRKTGKTPRNAVIGIKTIHKRLFPDQTV